MDRAHRIGQTRPVIVYRLATRGTVEETLLLKADGKRKLEKLVIQKGKFKSLFDGVDSKNSKLSRADAEDLHGVLANDEFEKYDVDTSTGVDSKGSILSEEELKILTDRSDKAYERAAKGDEGLSFKVAETKRGEQGKALDELTTKSGTR